MAIAELCWCVDMPFLSWKHGSGMGTRRLVRAKFSGLTKPAAQDHCSCQAVAAFLLIAVSHELFYCVAHVGSIHHGTLHLLRTAVAQRSRASNRAVRFGIATRAVGSNAVEV